MAGHFDKILSLFEQQDRGFLCVFGAIKDIHLLPLLTGDGMSSLNSLSPISFRYFSATPTLQREVVPVTLPAHE